MLEPTIVSKDGIQLKLKTQLAASDLSLANISGSSFSTFYGIAIEGLPFPIGTSQDLVVPHFSPIASIPSINSYKATVPGLSNHFACETVHPINVTEPTNIPWRSVLASWYLADVRTPSCNISGIIIAKGLDNNPDTIPVLQQYQGWWGNYTCNDGLSSDTYQPGTRPVKPGKHKHVMLLTTSLMRWSQEEIKQRREWVDEMTMVMCTPSYVVQEYSVSFASGDQDNTGPLQAQIQSETPRQLGGVSAVDLLTAAKSSAGNENIGVNSKDNTDMQTLDQLFHLMSIKKGYPKGNQNLSAFMDADVLASFGSNAVSGVISQVVHDYLLQPAKSSLEGSLLVSEARVQVKTLTTALLVSLLGLASIFGGLQILLAPKRVVPRDPRDLSATLAVLHASPKLWTRFRISEETTKADIGNELQKTVFSSTVSEHAFTIEPANAAGSNEVPKATESHVSKPIRWLRPFPLTLWFAGLTIGIPLALIAVLQVLQHQSDTYDGLLNVSTTFDTRLLTNYIPALIFTVTALFYARVNGSVLMFAPLIPLKKGGATAGQSLTLSLAAKFPPYILYLAVRYGLIATIFSVPAAFVASFLTTVGSGLYFAQAIPLVQSVSLVPQDTINLLASDLSLGDNLAGVVANELVYHNLSFPQWTYDGLVFPTLETHTNFQGTISDSARLSTQVQAIRPSLDCFILSPPDTGYAFPAFKSNVFSTLVFSGKLKPGFCRAYPHFVDINGNDVDFSFLLPVDGSNVTIGQSQTLLWLANDKNMTDRTKDGGCPTFAFSLGTEAARCTNPKQQVTDSDQYNIVVKADINVFVCYQHMEQVLVNLTLQPDLSIDTSQPPKPIESTIQPLNYTPGNPEFFYDLGSFTVNLAQAAYADASGFGGLPLDPFLQALIHSSVNPGYQLNELLTQPHKTLATAQRLYSLYMAQAINFNMRVPLSDSSSFATAGTSPSASYPATLRDPQRQRIVQSSPVKWALQAMLIFMAVCAVLTYVFSYTYSRELIKEYPPPNSIAGMMSLFAGSRMVEDPAFMGPGSEWRTASEDVKAWDGRVVSLGWWEKRGREGRRYGIDTGWPVGGPG